MAYGTRVHTETDANGIEYQIHIDQDDIPVRGNALASGDDAEDRAAENEILTQLDHGNLWAWCSVTVTARYGGFEGADHLGGCSYRGTEEFILPGGYYDDMKAEALTRLVASVSDGCKVYNELVAKGVI